MQPWQEVILSIGQLFFSFGTARMATNKKTRVPRTTSVPTASCLWAYIAVYGAARMWWVVGLLVVSAMSWTWCVFRRPA